MAVHTTSQNQAPGLKAACLKGSGDGGESGSFPSSPRTRDGLAQPRLSATTYRVVARDRALNPVASVLTEDEVKAFRIAFLWAMQTKGTSITVEVISCP